MTNAEAVGIALARYVGWRPPTEHEAGLVAAVLSVLAFDPDDRWQPPTGANLAAVTALDAYVRARPRAVVARVPDTD